MWFFLSLYLFGGVATSAITIAGDLRHQRIRLDDLDAEALCLLFILRVFSWPLAIIYYRKK